MQTSCTLTSAASYTRVPRGPWWVMYSGDSHSVGATPQTRCEERRRWEEQVSQGMWSGGLSLCDQEAWSPIQLLKKKK